MDTENIKSLHAPSRSFWLASAYAQKYPALDKDLKVDIAIIGGGITGIMCAYLLSKENIRLAVLEGNYILHGTTGHTTAKLTSQHGLIYDKIKSKLSLEFAQQYASANESAIRMVKKIIDENHIDCDFTSQSAYIYTQDDSYINKIQQEAKTAAALGIPAVYIEDIPLPFGVKAAVRFDQQAQFHPIKFLTPLVQKVSDSGGMLFEKTQIVDIEENEGYILTTGQGHKITAEKVIIATHYPFYNKHAFYFARIYQERSYVVAVRTKENYPGGMYISAESPTRSLRSQISDEGELILVGGENHKTGQGIDTELHYKTLADFSNEIFTVESIPYRWSAQDCMTLDGLPYSGYFNQKTQNLYVATGFQKWGMTNSVASAMLLHDLIVEGKSPAQDVYNPSRESFTASVGNFIVQNADVASEIVKGKFSPQPENVTIHLDEARIINYEGDRTGAYRDSDGKLYLVNLTCPHMGCELQWNNAEKTWDCPCHGSRFTYTGEVLDGPSVHPLTQHYNPNPISKLILEDF